MKSCYVIATYIGKKTNFNAERNRTYGSAEQTLKIHLNQLYTVKHSINTIIITKAEVDKDVITYNNYYPTSYRFSDVKEYEVINQGFSNGQWLRAYEKEPDYDYYFFCEDDYCPAIDNFDSEMINIYKQKFPNNIGFLSNLIQGYPKHDQNLPLHYEGIILLSKQTLQKLYNNFPNPAQYLDYISPPFCRIMNGGREQVNFTILFLLCEINVEDTIDKNYQFIYWNDEGELLYFFNKPGDYSDIVEKYEYSNIYINQYPAERLCIPIQLARTCIIIAGMHRSGTSVFSGCLNILGIDYGINKAEVKDEFNSKGYYENLSILRFNDNTLTYMLSSWHDHTKLASKQEELMMDKEEELTDIIINQYINTNTFFIKDPRISILLPLYIKVLKKLCITPILVYMQRDNLTIAKSLQRAQRVDIKKGISLSNKYKNCLLKNKQGLTLTTISFVNFLVNPIHYLLQVIKSIGKINYNIDIQMENKIKNFIDKDSVHF